MARRRTHVVVNDGSGDAGVQIAAAFCGTCTGVEGHAFCGRLGVETDDQSAVEVIRPVQRHALLVCDIREGGVEEAINARYKASLRGFGFSGRVGVTG